MDKWLKRREIILIKGPRQSGKTTLLLHLKEKLNGSYVTLEDEDIKLSLENNPKEFAKRYIEGRYLFIDEAQYLKNISSKEFGIRKIEKTKVAFVPYFFI